MTTTAQAMVLASFAADALALGAHWIYDTDVIDDKIGRVTAFRDPSPPTFHGTKKAGDFTHYGDQTFILLSSLAESSDFDLAHFAASWEGMFADYDGYFDGATKQTLKNLADGADPTASGSPSTDLAGAARIAPLVYRYRQDLTALTSSTRAQTAFTHNAPHVILAAEVFAGITLDVLGGAPPQKALADAQTRHGNDEQIARWLGQGLESAHQDTRQAIGEFGQMCEIDAAFPATIHLIAKYEEDLSAALIENVMAGGDSAGRGLLVGMVLGAYQGLTEIPTRWLSELKRHDQILALLEKLDQGAR